MRKIKYLLILFCLGCGTSKVTTTSPPVNAVDICPLLVGETLPQTTLKNVHGIDVNLQDSLKQKPSVLVFYRGGWCPYCNMQLSGLAQIEKEVIELGYQILAISPDDFKNLQGTQDKDSIGYQLYSDSGAIFCQAIGIAFGTPPLMKGYANSKGQKGKMSKLLPVPTVMVVDQAGKILFEYINPNYKQRLSGEMLLAVLKTLK